MSRAASMYSADIKKTVPIRFPHTPHHKIHGHTIATSVPGPLRRLPHHWLPGAVVPGLPAELPHESHPGAGCGSKHLSHPLHLSGSP